MKEAVVKKKLVAITKKVDY